MKKGFQKLFVLGAAILFFSFTPLFADEQADLALGKAVYNNDAAAAALLLEAGADPNRAFSTRDYDDNRTFLMVASSKGNVQLVKLLLDYGANPRVRSSWRGTAAHYVEGSNSAEILRLLASKGARFDVLDSRRRSPLMYHIAEGRGTMSGIMFMLDWEEEYSPDFTAGLQSRKDYYTKLLTLFLGRERYDSSAKFPLVERFLNGGADPAAKDDKGVPIVFLAFSNTRNDPLVRGGLLPLLIERGAPVNEFDDEGETLLMHTLNYRNADNVVKFLLDHGADPNLQDKNGETALMQASTRTAVDMLLASGADPNLQNKNGNTALLLHAWRHPQFIIPLLLAGADATHTDLDGNTALHYWWNSRSNTVLEALLFRGCPLDAPNHNGFTPLMRVARGGYGRAVLTLLEKGADPNRWDNDGNSVLYLYLEGSVKKQKGSVLVDDDGEKLETVVAALLAAGARPAVTNNKGNSALFYVTAEIRNKKYDTNYMALLRDMMLEYTNADEIKTANRVMRAVKAEERKKEFSFNLLPTITALSLPLIVGGLSIGMREGVYADRKSENWMGPVNGVLTLGMGGLLLGGGIGVIIAVAQDAGLGGILFALAGGILGGIGGILLACRPEVQRAFTDNPALYYAPTALSVLTAGIFIYRIWLY